LNQASILNFENVSFDVFQLDTKKNILKNISFTLFPNEITTLIGPNGAGKSTLINLMLGISKPTNGIITVKKNISIGYVPQKLKINQYLPLTVKDFFDLYIMPNSELLKKLKIDQLLKQSFHLLSGGERQRVLFAQALARQPQLLVLDEPTQGVDVIGQNDFFNLMLEFKEQFGYTVFLVSHDMHAVLASSDHIICLNQHICCSGHPKDIQHLDEYKKMLGHPIKPYEFTQYEHHHDHCHDQVCKHEKH
jgi:zinc transport system ATP-binding protein